MANLPIDAIQKNRPLDGLEKSFRVDSPLRLENRAIDVAVATGRDVSETAQKTMAGDNSPIMEAKSSVGDPVSNTLNRSIQNGDDPETAADALYNAQQKKSDLDKFTDFVLDGALTADNPNFNPAMARLVTNQQIAFEVFQERFEAANQDKGVVGTALDFLDRYLIRQFGIGTYEDLTGRTERKGLELAQAAASMGPEEYRDYITKYADEVANEGAFRSDNWFALQQGLSEAENAGYDPRARFTEMLSILDVPGIGAATFKVGKAITRVGKLAGVEAADGAAEALIKAGGDTIPEVADELLPGHMSVSRPSGSVGATESHVEEIFSQNKLVNDIQHLYQSGTFGRVATQEEILQATQKVRSDLAAVTSRPIAQTEVVDVTGLGDYSAVIKFGKLHSGKPLEDLESAEKLAALGNERGISATVVPVDADDLSKGYYIQVERRLDLTSVGKSIDVNTAFEGLNNSVVRALTSARAGDDPRLATLANMGESGGAAIADLAKPYLKRISNLPFESKVAMDAVWRNLRDGKDAYLRSGYTESEFKTQFKRYHPKGKAATQKDIEAFYDLQTLNDAAYILTANKLTTKYVTKGYKALEIGGAATPGKKMTTKIDDAAEVFDAKSGKVIKAKEIPEGSDVWKLDRPMAKEQVEYVTRPTSVRELQYDDVLGYNAGGTRLNPDANYFVTFGSGRGRAMLTTFTDKQARAAADQLENIFSAIRSSGRNLDELGDSLDSLIKRNNDWNPSITRTSDLVDLIKRKGWDTNQPVSYKQRGGTVEAEPDSVFEGMNYGEYTMAIQRRNDDVLMEYGGAETFNHSPINSITSQLSNAAHEYSMKAYNYNAKTAWLKKALRTDKLPAGTDVNRLFRDTDVTGNGKLDRQLRDLKKIVERRDGVDSPAVEALKDWGQDLSEFVFDKTSKKMSFDGAEGALLQFGFQSAFGFLNVSQFFLQATHAFTIAAISPKYGSAAAGLTVPMRMAMHSPAPELAFKRLSKFTGIDTKQLEEMAEYMRTSGRMNVEADAIERGTGAGFGLSAWEGGSMKASGLNKVLAKGVGIKNFVAEKGIVFFNEGERLSRQTALYTAMLERQAKFGGSLLTDDARAWITRREQDLSFNMTTTSRGTWQTGLWKVPTQWLSYSMRSLEAITVGKGLSGAERARLGTFMLLAGGGAGLGLNSAVDKMASNMDLDPAGIGFTTLKYGVFDAMFSWAFSEMSGENIRTAFGTRIAPMTAFLDLWRKANDESLVVAVGGPSGEIASGTFDAFMGVVDALYNGHTISAGKDIERILRTPTGVDNIVKAYGIYNHGVYRSKTGTTLPMEFSNVEALMQAGGVTNFKVAEFYNRRTTAFRDSKDLKDATKKVQNDFRMALAMMEDDPDRGLQMMREIEAGIQISGFSVADQMQLRRAMRTDTSNDVAAMSLELLRQENEYGARVVEGLNTE
jgi:hypothetical protein